MAIQNQDISGIISDGQGNPVSGVNVELFEYGISLGNLNLVGTQVTNNSGEYTFTSQDVRQYLVRAQPLDGYIPTYHESTGYWQHAQMVYQLCDAQVTSDVTFVASNNPLRTGVIAGYLNGSGVFRAGDPIEGVNVLLYDLEADTLVHNSITNQNGYYEMDSLFSGSYYILVDAEGLAMISTHFLSVQEGEIIEEANFFADEDGVFITGNYQSAGFVSTDQNTERSNFLIYPNPGSENLNIQNNTGESFEVVVYGTSGKKIRDYINMKGSLSIDTKDLQKGTYMIVIRSSSSTEVIKWIKK